MNLLDGANKRLRELRRAGVNIPWEAAGLDAGGAAPMLEGQGPVGVRMPRAPGPRASTSVDANSPSVEIDLQRIREMGYLVPEMATSLRAEEFRQVKRAVLANVVRDEVDDHGATVMVTSALPGEGKTFCAINLAISIAMEVDTSVLLVDADVLRPSIFERLGLPEPKQGLLDVVVDDRISLSDVLWRTNVPKLSLLATGTPNINASDLLAGASMQRVLQQLLDRYPDRVVIVDTPPLLVASGAASLARTMGQVIMVVEASTTLRRHVAQAFAAVEDCPNVMTVLNRCTASQERRAYGYYYGHGAAAPKSWFRSRRDGG